MAAQNLGADAGDAPAMPCVLARRRERRGRERANRLDGVRIFLLLVGGSEPSMGQQTSRPGSGHLGDGIADLSRGLHEPQRARHVDCGVALGKVQ